MVDCDPPRPACEDGLHLCDWDAVALRCGNFSECMPVRGPSLTARLIYRMAGMEKLAVLLDGEKDSEEFFLEWAYRKELHDCKEKLSISALHRMSLRRIIFWCAFKWTVFWDVSLEGEML
jgi:hypothetical protein